MAQLPNIESVFSEAQKIENKEGIIDTVIHIVGFAEMDGSEGKFAVVCFNTGKKELFTTGFNTIILHRLKKAVETVGVNEVLSNDRETYFKEPISVFVRHIPSEKVKGRKYFDLENA
jgi:hypothetical protein